MKKTMHVVVMAAGLLGASAYASADIGVSVSVGQPGFYGRIDIGSAPRPAVIHAQPVIIHQPAVRVVQQPVYMRVPPGHAKHWAKHCGKYNACGQPVYFVQEQWYEQTYATHSGGRGKRHGGGHHDR